MSKSFKNSLVSVIAASLAVLGATVAQAQTCDRCLGPGVVTERPLYQQAADEIRSWSFGKMDAQTVLDDVSSPDTVPVMDLIDSTRMSFAQTRAAGKFTLYSPTEPTTGPEGAPYNWVYSADLRICTTDGTFRASKAFRLKVSNPIPSADGLSSCFAVRVLPPLPWLPQQGQ